MPLPTHFKFQSVDESKVAERLARCLSDGPHGRVSDFGGPEVLTVGGMAEQRAESQLAKDSRVARAERTNNPASAASEPPDVLRLLGTLLELLDQRGGAAEIEIKESKQGIGLTNEE